MDALNAFKSDGGGRDYISHSDNARLFFTALSPYACGWFACLEHLRHRDFAQFSAVLGNFARSDRAQLCCTLGPTGESFLHVACSSGCFKAVKMLVEEYNAPLDVRDRESGFTPLHRACVAVNIPIVLYLLSKNVDVDGRDRSGSTPLDLLSTYLISLRQSMEWSHGDLYTWGHGTSESKQLPKRIDSFLSLDKVTRIASVAVSNHRQLAVDTDGNLYEWGAPFAKFEKNKAATSTHDVKVDGADVILVPRIVSDIQNVAGACVSDTHACAWTHDGTAYCWGWGGHYALGTGSKTDVLTPVKLPITHVTHMACSQMHTLALLDDGRVMAWGSDHDKQGLLAVADTSVISKPKYLTIDSVTSVCCTDRASVFLTNGNVLVCGYGSAILKRIDCLPFWEFFTELWDLGAEGDAVKSMMSTPTERVSSIRGGGGGVLICTESHRLYHINEEIYDNSECKHKQRRMQNLWSYKRNRVLATPVMFPRRFIEESVHQIVDYVMYGHSPVHVAVCDVVGDVYDMDMTEYHRNVVPLHPDNNEILSIFKLDSAIFRSGRACGQAPGTSSSSQTVQGVWSKHVTRPLLTLVNRISNVCCLAASDTHTAAITRRITGIRHDRRQFGENENDDEVEVQHKILSGNLSKAFYTWSPEQTPDLRGDVELIVTDGRLTAHKIFLARSRWFADRISQSEIDLRDFDANKWMVSVLLHYLYTDIMPDTGIFLKPVEISAPVNLNMIGLFNTRPEPPPEIHKCSRSKFSNFSNDLYLYKLHDHVTEGSPLHHSQNELDLLSYLEFRLGYLNPGLDLPSYPKSLTKVFSQITSKVVLGCKDQRTQYLVADVSILVIRSEFFKLAVTSDFKEGVGATKTISLDEDVDTVSSILKYLYTCRFPSPPPGRLLYLLPLANMLLLDELVEIAEEGAVVLVDRHSCIDILPAAIKLRAKGITKACMAVISTGIKELLLSSSRDMYRLPLPEVCTELQIAAGVPPNNIIEALEYLRPSNDDHETKEKSGQDSRMFEKETVHVLEQDVSQSRKKKKGKSKQQSQPDLKDVVASLVSIEEMVAVETPPKTAWPSLAQSKQTPKKSSELPISPIKSGSPVKPVVSTSPSKTSGPVQSMTKSSGWGPKASTSETKPKTLSLREIQELERPTQKSPTKPTTSATPSIIKPSTPVISTKIAPTKSRVMSLAEIQQEELRLKQGPIVRSLKDIQDEQSRDLVVKQDHLLAMRLANQSSVYRQAQDNYDYVDVIKDGRAVQRLHKSMLPPDAIIM